MMGNLSVRVRGLSKAYQIVRAGSASYRTFRDDIAVFFRGLRHGFPEKKEKTPFWALEDVDLDVCVGEAVGIIGRNGAGKSTLLKILSRITEPTRGRVELYGRVASLLEVGTGFHPELTGRENIYLNGSILGMRRKEIQRKLDEIVNFAEVEMFLDTPVKHYSSGMYVRLAFAVAAHLEPEILIVDEVLAVGDAAFQKKCLGKMSEVTESGRTVLLVSHTMSAITNLCNRAVWISNGRIAKAGVAADVVATYLTSGELLSGEVAWPVDRAPSDGSITVNAVRVVDRDGQVNPAVNISEKCGIEIDFAVVRNGARAIVAVVIVDAQGNTAFSSLNNTPEDQLYGKSLASGQYRSICSIPGNLLNDGRYSVSVLINSGYGNDVAVHGAVSFDAIDDGILRRDYHGRYSGVVRPRLIWSTMQLPSGRDTE